MEKNKQEVFTKCKRGSCQITAGQSCDSNRAYKMNNDGSHVVVFVCVKCRYKWSVAVGGSFSL